MYCPTCKVEMVPSNHEEPAEYWDCPVCNKSYIRCELEPILAFRCSQCANREEWLQYASLMGPCRECKDSPLAKDNFRKV